MWDRLSYDWNYFAETICMSLHALRTIFPQFRYLQDECVYIAFIDCFVANKTAELHFIAHSRPVEIVSGFINAHISKRFGALLTLGRIECDLAIFRSLLR